MGRSLRVKPEMIKRVKEAVCRNGFPSQVVLSLAIGIHRTTLNKFLNGGSVEFLNAEEICKALGLDLGDITGYAHPASKIRRRVDWGEALDNTDLSAREEELNILEQRIVADRCRLVLIGGMNGMGKTNLSCRLGKRIQEHFDFVIWRSLDQFNSIEDLLTDLHSFFVGEQRIESLSNIRRQDLKSYLKDYRCLLIYANIDRFLQDYSFNSQNQEYETFLRWWMAEIQDKSCLVMTSSVKPREIDSLKGSQFVLCLNVEPLSIDAIRDVFSDIGVFYGSEKDWSKLQTTYSGNPFILKNIAVNIQRSFGGNITDFITYDTFVFNGVEEFLDRQLGYLSEMERTVMYWLAIYRYPISIFELKEIIPDLSSDKLLYLNRE